MSFYDDSGYDLNDPKHPTFHDRYADAADMARKRAKEDQHAASVPYPGYCSQPDVCAGNSHCPRDPSCIE